MKLKKKLLNFQKKFTLFFILVNLQESIKALKDLMNATNPIQLGLMLCLIIV